MVKKRSLASFLWVTDPWETLDHPKDTSLRLAEEALILGVKNYWCDVKTIRIESGRVLLEAAQIRSISPRRTKDAFEFSRPCSLMPEAFGSIQYRPDPPIDLSYLHPLQILELGTRISRTPIVNSTKILFALNEKFEASLLKGLMPPSIVSTSWDRLSGFGIKQEITVLKPLFNAQSRGIEKLNWQSRRGFNHAQNTLRLATDGFTRPVMLQRFLPGILDGEKRLWFVDGTLIAYARKLPVQGDFRVNMDQGSELTPTSLNAVEKKASLKISKHLRSTGIRLAAVDLIDGFITDLNFTSPGLIPQMESLLNVNLARLIIQSLLKT